MDKKDWIIIAVSMSKDGYLSPAQLQKGMFLLKMKAPSAIKGDFYEFAPYHYGPFTKEIYMDVERMEAQGFIEYHRPALQRWSDYALTDKGKEYAEKLKKNYDKEGISYLGKLIEWMKSITFKQLLMSIYKEFPEYKENSIFMG